MLSKDHENTLQIDGPSSMDKRPPTSSARRRKSRGQSLVEFAVLLPILVMILALAADFGRGLTAYIAISSAAREGAAYGMMSSEQSKDVTKIRTVALADSGEIWGTTPTVTSTTRKDAQGYEQVSVTVEYAFTPILPITSIFPGMSSPIQMERTVTMRVLN